MLAENLNLAWETVRAHKMRSLLTMLGVFVGTITLIAVGSLLTGFNQRVIARVEGFGTDTIFVTKFFMFHPPTPEEIHRKPINDNDIAGIRATCTACRSVVPMAFPNWGTPLIARWRSREALTIQFRGSTSDFALASNVDIARGRIFTPIENEHRERVAVISPSVAQALYGSENAAVGREILVGDGSFRVIGVFSRSRNAGNDTDDGFIVIPYNTFEKLYPNSKERFVAVLARHGELREALDQVRVSLRRTRRVPYGKPDNFALATADDLIAQFHQVIGTVALVIVVISSIGMLIGGVGVMNIMLVSVTERTREIGVRKAIGARRSDITQQFLAEAVTLTGAGGLLGIAGGWAVSLLLNLLLPRLPSAVPLWAAVLGFCVSVGIGIFFGLFPAVKAAQLDPVVALRYE